MSRSGAKFNSLDENRGTNIFLAGHQFGRAGDKDTGLKDGILSSSSHLSVGFADGRKFQLEKTTNAKKYQAVTKQITLVNKQASSIQVLASDNVDNVAV
jgi:hypothetical protein